MMDARLFSVGHTFALFLKVLSICCSVVSSAWVPLVELLGRLAFSWVAGNNSMCAASLGLCYWHHFGHPVSKAGLSLEEENRPQS